VENMLTDKAVMAKAYTDFPRKDKYKFEHDDGKHICGHFVIYCFYYIEEGDQ